MKLPMLKKIGAITFALSLTMAASALDFGGMLTNDTKIAGKDFSNLLLDQKNALSAWLRLPFNAKGTTYFAMEGMYQFEYQDVKLGDTEGNAGYVGAVDLNLFKFGTLFEGNNFQVGISVGRFFTTDLSGLVYSQNADGGIILLETPLLTLSLYGAYTGLLNARTVSFVDTDVTEDTDKHYQRAEEYVVGATTLSFPNLFANQTISAQFFGAMKMKGDGYNRWYVEVGMNGPILPCLFYTVNSTLAIYRDYETANSQSVANLSKAALYWYVPQVDNLAFALNAVYASGDNGGLDPFLGFTSQTATNALSGRTEYTGLLKAGLAASKKILDNLLVGANGDVIFNAEDSLAYEGFQYGINANWQILSDISVGALFYQYYDTDDSDRNKTCIQLKAAISF